MRKTDKRQNPTARQIRLHPYRRPAEARRAAMRTKLDADAKIRAALVKRITDEIVKSDIPVMVLHQLAQCLEMWQRDQ